MVDFSHKDAVATADKHQEALGDSCTQPHVQNMQNEVNAHRATTGQNAKEQIDKMDASKSDFLPSLGLHDRGKILNNDKGNIENRPELKSNSDSTPFQTPAENGDTNPLRGVKDEKPGSKDQLDLHGAIFQVWDRIQKL